jgi:hypothetical protein
VGDRPIMTPEGQGGAAGIFSERPQFDLQAFGR